MTEWFDINDKQPEPYEDVLWYCKGGRKLSGMYYGKDHCEHLPDGHPMYRRPREYYGKYGRYAEPAEDGYVVTHWCYLPEDPVNIGD